jgi:Tripartite tricarboxylate transporter TctB family
MQASGPVERAAERARDNAADFLSGVAFVLLGIALLYGAVTMPTLENRGVHPLTAPGLVPGGLAIALILCGGLLAAGARRGGGIGEGLRALAAIFRGPEAARVGSAVVLVLVYTLGLVGWLPFWLATALFVFAFILCFEQLLPNGAYVPRRTLLWGATVALVAGWAVVLVFERGFLVRLP